MSAWPERTRRWMPGAKAALREMATYAHVFIWSARLNPQDPMNNYEPKDPARVQEEYDYIRGMLDDANLPHIGIWTHPGKPGASVYIDDKAERYTGRAKSWQKMREKVKARCRKQDAWLPPNELAREEREA